MEPPVSRENSARLFSPIAAAEPFCVALSRKNEIMYMHVLAPLPQANQPTNQHEQPASHSISFSFLFSLYFRGVGLRSRLDRIFFFKIDRLVWGGGLETSTSQWGESKIRTIENADPAAPLSNFRFRWGSFVRLLSSTAVAARLSFFRSV